MPDPAEPPMLYRVAVTNLSCRRLGSATANASHVADVWLFDWVVFGLITVMIVAGYANPGNFTKPTRCSR